MALHEEFEQAIDKLENATTDHDVLSALQRCHVLSGRILLEAEAKCEQREADYDRLMKGLLAGLDAGDVQPEGMPE